MCLFLALDAIPGYFLSAFILFETRCLLVYRLIFITTFREKRRFLFDLEYLAFFRDVYLIQDTVLTFSSFFHPLFALSPLRGIMWHAILREKRWGPSGADTRVQRGGAFHEKGIIFLSTSTGKIKAVPPPPLFHKKFRSTGHTTTLLSILSIRWELGVVSLICIWRKWVVFS